MNLPLDVMLTVSGYKSNIYNNRILLLSQYPRTSDATPWRQLRSHAIQIAHTEFDSDVLYHLALIYIPNKEKVVKIDDAKLEVIINIILQSDERLEQIEFFQSYLGDMGTVVNAQPVSIGFVDLGKGLRYEFVDGVVTIREQKIN